MEPLAGKVAWVAGVGGLGKGDGELEPLREAGRAIALLLAASGGAVLVSGAAERALGACVGEIAHGGGKARHRVGGLGTADDARALVQAVVERFGALDVAVVVAATIEEAARAFDAAGASMRPGGRLILVSAKRERAKAKAYVETLAARIASSGLACHAVLVGAAEPEEVARAVESLATDGVGAVSASSVTLG